MLLSNLKISFRSLLKQRRFSAINIVGLTLSMTVALIIFLFVQQETSYEHSYSGYENIYRLTARFNLKSGEEKVAVTPYPLAPTLATELPEVEAATRIQKGRRQVLLKNDGKEFYESNYATVDSSFLKVFDLELVSGDIETIFTEPNQVLLEEKIAEKFFGNQNPIGQIINSNNTQDLTVAGVYKKPNPLSHLSFDVLLPWQNRADRVNMWNNMLNYYSYVKLAPNVNTNDFTKKVNDLTQKRHQQALAAVGNNDENVLKVFFDAQPIADIHLHSQLKHEISANSQVIYVYAYILVAAIMLLIAVINFMNLSTARSANRAKEVGVRKVIGASRWESSSQYLLESLLQSFIAMILAFFLTELTLPYFNSMIQMDLSLANIHFPTLILSGILLAGIVGLLAGIYPTFFMSSFEPIKVLKGDYSKNKESAPLRKGLVVTQFTICCSLILFLGIAIQQIDYISGKSLGFSPEQVLTISTQTQDPDLNRIKRELSDIPGVQSVSAVNRLPSENMGGNNLKFGDQASIVAFNRVDENYLSTLNIELIAGRNFRAAEIQDSIEKIIINEAFVDFFNIKGDPVGQHVMDHITPLEIIGVVKNFHWKGLNESIAPFAIKELDRPFRPKIAVALKTANISQTLPLIEQKWKTFEPNYPIQYSFLASDFGALFYKYQHFKKALFWITGLIVFTSILGLFGLAAFMTEQRNKEIGIRKVLGASIEQVMFLITKDFLKLVLFAALIAFPIGYFLAHQWLADFAYRISIGASPFVLTLITVLVISGLTVGVQAWYAAVSNPVESIRPE